MTVVEGFNRYITSFKLDYDFTSRKFCTTIFFAVQSGLTYLNITYLITGTYAHMTRHTSDYGSCGQERLLILNQLDAVVVLVVVRSLVITEMVQNFSNLVGMTFKMELIWQHLGKF
jgi:hypothetical protein